MQIAQIVPSLELRHGGPSKSVRLLAQAQGHAGHAVTLFSTHPGAAVSKRENDLNLEIFHRSRPQFICRSPALAGALMKTRHDCIHHHALWLRTLHYAHQAAMRHACPLIASPRGMMSPWSWHHKRWKKLLAHHFIHPGALKAVTGWHATSTEEADDIRKLGFTQPVCIAPNGINEPDAADTARAVAYWRNAYPEGNNHPVAVFYSRFHRKKRVLDLIDLWLQTAPPEWQLLLVGIPQEYSVASLEEYVVRASGSGRIRIFDGTQTPPPFAIASLFLLPSHSENFGLVIAEAMAHGVPVVVTDSTPWNGVNSDQLGWCVPWEEYASALKEALAQSPARLADRGARARSWVLDNFSWGKSAAILTDFYRTLR